MPRLNGELVHGSDGGDILGLGLDRVAKPEVEVQEDARRVKLLMKSSEGSDMSILCLLLLVLLMESADTIDSEHQRKQHGMGVARKLKRQRLADKSHKKSHLGSELKKPFAGYSHAKGVVQEIM
ncbi:hypothetical protein E3N88_42676 [Mikania micrantha]|uniref:Uncharacterized protein n=1 Tax=Mikania micrantha TaxID=192012 RepID=A0A5N6LHY7_9ASTR|nr:hypothetical protein E3N88_42676 [Mikania micrantha]